MRGLNDTEDADETDETTTAGPYCDSLTMPTPATASAFTCYGPLGIGQECRAQCEDLNNSEAVIRCESDLLWAELERCPGLETTESDSDNTDETVIIVGIVGGSVGGFVMLGLAVMYMRSKSKSKAVADLAEIQTVQERRKSHLRHERHGSHRKSFLKPSMCPHWIMMQSSGNGSMNGLSQGRPWSH